MSSEDSVAPVWGLVLAGGASQRMQQDKAALLYQGQPQLQRAYELLARHCVRTFISVRADQQPDELRSNWPQIADQHADKGPLAGIGAAQQAHPDVAWLVVACDLPLLNDASIQYLLQRRDSKYTATAYRSARDQRPEPLCAIWEPSGATAIQAALAGSNYSLRALLESWNTLSVTALEPDALQNVNTPNEHQQAQDALSHQLSLNLQYFALFREQAGKRSEVLLTSATTPALLYAELQQRYGFKLAATQLKIAVNNEFCDWQQPLKSGDNVAFIPPVAGG